jgi:hypothetical protein
MREDSAEVVLWKGQYRNDGEIRRRELERLYDILPWMRGVELRGHAGEWRLVVEGQRESWAEATTTCTDPQEETYPLDLPFGVVWVETDDGHEYSARVTATTIDGSRLCVRPIGKGARGEPAPEQLEPRWVSAHEVKRRG